jgi:hypothetical protein
MLANRGDTRTIDDARVGAKRRFGSLFADVPRSAELAAKHCFEHTPREAGPSTELPPCLRFRRQQEICPWRALKAEGLAFPWERTVATELSAHEGSASPPVSPPPARSGRLRERTPDSCEPTDSARAQARPLPTPCHPICLGFFGRESPVSDRPIASVAFPKCLSPTLKPRPTSPIPSSPNAAVRRSKPESTIDV